MFVRALCSLLLFSGMVNAGTVDIHITNQFGEPLANAVVEILQPKPPTAAADTVYVYQQDLAFNPYVTAIPVGTYVNFPNLDKTRHHVFSFSPAKTFEIKLFVGKPRDPILFDKPGIVALGCNIHDNMQAFIYVGTSHQLAVTNAQGIASFTLPDTFDYQIKLWHPWQLQDHPEQQISSVSPTLAFSMTVDAIDDPSIPPKGFGNSY